MRTRIAVCFGLSFCAAFTLRGQTPSPDAEKFAALSSAAPALAETKPEESADLYKKALELRPKWPEGWFGLGRVEYRLKRYAPARTAFRKAVELAPGNGAAWSLLGLSEVYSGDLDKGYPDIQKGEQLGLGPATVEITVREETAAILIRDSVFDRAVAQLQGLARNRMSPAEAIQMAGQCALAEPRSLSELSAKRRAAVEVAGKAIWNAMSHAPIQQIEADFKQLLAQFPNEEGVHYAYGLYRQNTADQEGALAEFEKELAAHPDHWMSLLGGAALLTKQDKPEQAIDWTKRGCKAAPVSYRWLCDGEIGRALMSMNQADKAVPMLEESIKLHPGNSQTHFYLAQAYKRTGKKDEAEKERAEFLRLKTQQDPTSVPGVQPTKQ